jgi:hypothetical protein
LACIWIHVGKEPHTEKKVWVELLRLDMRYRLVDTRGLSGQKLNVSGSGRVIRSFSAFDPIRTLAGLVSQLHLSSCQPLPSPVLCRYDALFCGLGGQ